jgi:hypothetical protein
MHCATNVAGVPAGIGNPAVAVVPAIADVPADVLTSVTAPRLSLSDYKTMHRNFCSGLYYCNLSCNACHRKDEL